MRLTSVIELRGQYSASKLNKLEFEVEYLTGELPNKHASCVQMFKI